MNKSELLEKIREKNEELDSLNKELKEIIAEEKSINKEEQTIEALCVTYEEDEEYSISFLPALSFEYINGLALMSSKVFEKLYKEVMEKINK